MFDMSRNQRIEELKCKFSFKCYKGLHTRTEALAQALLIAGVKEVPSIEMISKTIRRSKNVGDHLKESLVHHLDSRIECSDGCRNSKDEQEG